MKSIYGPVSSWRLGASLGIDPICNENKICSFNCVYCQLGKKGDKIYERKEFIPLSKLKEDIGLIKGAKADIITFAGTGEPTLAKNLGDMVDYIRKISKLPIAILTNSTLLSNYKVRNILYGLDNVVAKLDVPNEELFEKINQPHKKINFKNYIEGIKKFRGGYSGKFSLQMMFLDLNKEYAKEMVELAKSIQPDEVQINTPLRPKTKWTLNEEDIRKIKEFFSDFDNVISVYEVKRKKVKPIDMEELRKRKRTKI